jgi:hypothetical protein
LRHSSYTAIFSKVRLSVAKSFTSGADVPTGFPSFSEEISTRRFAFGKSSGRNTTAFSTLNTDAVAPIPSASVSTTTDVNPGDFRICRSA